MRILQFGRFWNRQAGGIERHVHVLSKGLAGAGHEVVNLVANTQLRTRVSLVDGVTLVEAASLGKLFSTAISFALVREALRLHREKPFDVFHLHFPDPLTHGVSILLPRHVPRVMTWHSDIIKQKKLQRIYRPWQEREVRRASALIAATPAHFESSDQIPPDFPAQRRHVIPYAVDFDRLTLNDETRNLRENLRKKAGNRTLVFALGRHVYYKGFDVLINAIALTDCILILGGDGPLRPGLEHQARMLGLLEDRVIFTGNIAASDLPAYFHACDFFVLPSVERSEAFGLVQIEAMACSKPVICTRLNNGVNFVNPHGLTGLTVTAKDAGALTEAIRKLSLNPALRAELGQNAFRHVQRSYTLDSMVSSHEEVYRQVIEERSA